jgi:hypothetical protein
MSFFSGYSWDTDVVPQITAWLQQDVIKWGTITLISISVATFAGVMFLGMFVKNK